MKPKILGLVVIALFLLAPVPCWAATRTWDGGGGSDTNWNTAANWSSNSIPGSSDIAAFDSTSTNNCTINVSISVAGIVIQSGYTGTITQASGNTITVGTSDFTQTAGTFTGGNSSIDCNDVFTLTAGTFTSTSGTLFIADNFRISGGTFNHNSATVKMDDSSSKTIDIGSATLNHFIIEKGAGTLTVTGTADVNGNLTITSAGSIRTGTINVAGNVTSTDTSVSGTANLKFDGTGAQTLTASGADFPNGTFTLDKSSGAVTLASDVTVGPALTITNGTLSQGASYKLTASAGITVGAGGILLNTGTGDLTLGGNLANSGTVTLDSNGSGSGNNDILVRSTNTTKRTWSGAGTFTLTDLDVARMMVGATPGTLTVMSGTDSENNTNWIFSDLDPVLHHKMDDGSGTTSSDSSGNGYDGTLLGGIIWTTDRAPLAATNSYANSFDGADDSISVADAALLNPTLAFTLSAWIKPASVAAGVVLAKWSAAANKRQYALRLSGGKLVLEVSTNGQSGTVRSVTSSGSITAESWTHVAGVYEADTMKVYVDGTSTSASFSLAGAFSSNPLLRMGREEDGTYFNGLIDEVRIYNRALTDSEISALAEKDTTPPEVPSGLILEATSDGLGIKATVTAPSDTDVAELIWRYNSADGNTTVSAPSNSTQGTAFGAGVTTGVTASSVQEITASPLPNLKTYAVAVWAKDSAGNISTSGAAGSFYLAPPTPRLVITASSAGMVAAQAGSTQIFTITARDADNNVITSYAGPYTLTWTPQGGSAVTLVSNSTSGWSSGAVTASVTIGGSNAGSGSLQAVDNSTNDLDPGSFSFLWYPASFSVTTSSSTLVAGTPFTLNVAAKDLADATVTRYAGTAALNLIYELPDSGAKPLSKTSVIPAEFTNGLAAVSVTYLDAGRIKIQAQDTTLVSGVTITGTSETKIFSPALFKVVLSPLPARLTKVYVGQPFDVSVEALAADQATLTPNYGGTVALSASGGGVGPSTYAFLPAVDRGKHLFTGIRATSSGEVVFSAQEGSIVGTSAPLGVRAGILVINPVQGLPGELKTTAFILDQGTNQVVSEDDSTRFLLILENPTEGSVATSPAAVTPVRVSSGIAALTVTKPDQGQVTVRGTVLGFSMPSVSAPLKWVSTAAQSGSALTVLQFEQGAVSRPQFSPVLSLGQTREGLRPPPDFQTMDSFRQGPSRFDTQVSTGYTLVAPPSRGRRQGQNPSFGPGGPFERLEGSEVMQQIFQGNVPGGWGPSEGFEGGPAWMMGPGLGGQQVTPWGDTGRDFFQENLTGESETEEKKEEGE
ncbi:MAG: LamG-like jellyroll fold domain-containing protein [Candidatus Omnitrophota bacterium]|nr:LamG-like jellyroll fold domain-containing protein [Candidatus Omnitrophota bacterium]